MSEIAAQLREFGESRENLPIGADEVKAGERDGKKCGGEKKIKLSLHAVVNVRDACSGLFLAFVIFNQQARYGGTQSLLAGLKRESDLLTCFVFFGSTG